MSALLIDIADLVDMYREDGPEGIWWPTLYRAEVGGVSWLTDRYWLLPESVCELPDGVKVVPLPATNAEKITEWVDAPVADGPYNRQFAPCFAGTLTVAGLCAVALDGYPDMAGLVTEAGERVGFLMPHKEATPLSVPLPVSAETVAMFERISDAGVVRTYEAWALAAHLTRSSSRLGNRETN